MKPNEKILNNHRHAATAISKAKHMLDAYKDIPTEETATRARLNDLSDTLDYIEVAHHRSFGHGKGQIFSKEYNTQNEHYLGTLRNDIDRMFRQSEIPEHSIEEKYNATTSALERYDAQLAIHDTNVRCTEVAATSVAIGAIIGSVFTFAAMKGTDEQEPDAPQSSRSVQEGSAIVTSRTSPLLQEYGVV